MTFALYRLMVRTQLTRARVLGLLALGVIGIITAMAIGASNLVDHQLAGGRFIDNFGLALLAPVATLVFASAALGDPNEDGTLVYLWLRPGAAFACGHRRHRVVDHGYLAHRRRSLAHRGGGDRFGSGLGERHGDRLHRRGRCLQRGVRRARPTREARA